LTLGLSVEGLTIRGFRNIAELRLDGLAHVNVFAGDNGQGKTSVLEALYLLATTRSFRTEKPLEACQMSSETTVVEARFKAGDLARTQRYVVHQGKRGFFVAGKRSAKYSAYAVQTPVVVFHPNDLQLVGGPASGRRTLLDRVGFFLDPSLADARTRYSKAQRERQAALERRGPNTPELDAFEVLMAQAGAAITRQRQHAALALARELLPTFAEISAHNLALEATYRPGGSADEQAARLELRQRRVKDLQRGSATFGPQKDELELNLDGRSARQHASQGQQRLLTLALKFAELSSVRDARGMHPILLLDDVSSELDPKRTGAVYDLVQRSESQVLVTTTRPELFDTSGMARGARADFRMSGGQVVKVS
jgi:DNA replication and repair protein RecF